MMGANIGIQAEWISTHLNGIVDDISRLKTENNGDFDYAKLNEIYPILNPCCQFQPSTALLTMIWDVLLNKRCPDPLIMKGLKPVL